MPKSKSNEEAPAAPAAEPATETAGGAAPEARPLPQRPEPTRAELEALREKLRRKFH